MNNKQVPEEIKNQIEAAAADAIPILSEEEYRKGWHEESYFHYQQALSLERSTFRIGAEYGYSLASLPAEPSTSETKDKPATGSGGAPESILYKHLDFEWVMSTKKYKWEVENVLAAMKEYATLRQPTGTGNWTDDDIVWAWENAFGDNGHKSGQEYLQHLKSTKSPIQFMPEREGVSDDKIDDLVFKLWQADDNLDKAHFQKHGPCRKTLAEVTEFIKNLKKQA